MILPTKHVSTEHSLLGMGAAILRHLSSEQTVIRLWERVRSSGDVASFERFILALDFLYSLDAVEMQDGLLRRRHT